MVDFRSLVPWRERSLPLATKEEFLDPFVSFRREVDRMFDSFFEGFGRSSGVGWAGLTPALDVADNDKELVITAEVPGVTEKDVDVTISGDVLTIKGEKKAEESQKNGDFAYVERRYGSFSRSVRLPFNVNDENINATYDKGILTIRIPKPVNAQSSARRIEVKAA